MHRQVLQLHVDREPEHQAEKTKEQADEQQAMSIDTHESYLRQIRQLQCGLATFAWLRQNCGRAERTA